MKKKKKECALKAFRTCLLRERMDEHQRTNVLYLDHRATKLCHIDFSAYFLPVPVFIGPLTLQTHYPLLCNTQRKYIDNLRNAEML